MLMIMRDFLPPWDDNLVYSFHHIGILIMKTIWTGYYHFGKNTTYHYGWENRVKTLIPGLLKLLAFFENNNIGWAWWTMRKIGDIDSPYAVDINPGYRKNIDYWKDEGPRPTEGRNF